uniref:N-acetyltransferase domain-containing protein n=1 Tax=Nyssomyia neivai TaxID=330878 RepID=A0A1L8DD55_9DIPT
MKWERPESVSFTNIWLNFTAKDPDSGQIVNYYVQDVPEERFDEVAQLMATIFTRDETMCKSLDIINDPMYNMEDSIKDWKNLLKQRMSLICFKEGSDEICGINMLEVLGKHEVNHFSFNEDTDDKDQYILKVIEFVKSKVDPCNRYHVDKYLHCLGLLILPKYRGLGLATEILKARIPMGKALGLTLSGTLFTGIAAQKAGLRAGFIEDYSVLYGDLANQEPFVEFPNISSQTLKFMSLHLK